MSIGLKLFEDIKNKISTEPEMDFYYSEYSPPCRAVALTAKALGISLLKKKMNLQNKEHLTPEFLSINPQHCIPTLVDGDLSLWESRVICTYLVSKYGKDDSLYPSHPDKRVLVDRLLQFDLGVLTKRISDYYVNILHKTST
ncbi:Glutathione S-transferase theta-1 [Armadillidium vulgare]|nr:Glutathione S-transferase theta-1 [Armadillidium vulgare]